MRREILPDEEATKQIRTKSVVIYKYKYKVYCKCTPKHIKCTLGQGTWFNINK